MTVDKGIFIKNIYYMLSYAFKELQQEDFKNVAGKEFKDIHNLFAAIIAKCVSRQLKQGLYREYVPAQEDLTVMRGKLNINSTVRLQVQNKQKLFCEFDEFSEDNLYNQILKVTIYRLIRAKGVKPEQKQALRSLIGFFDNVRLIQTDHIPWNRLAYQRSNRNYELLLNLCRLMLKEMLQTTEDGSYKLISFSDKHMERLFERFIFEYYKKHHDGLTPNSDVLDWNYTSPLPDEKMKRIMPKMHTDVTLHKDGKTLIIDAKYYKNAMAQYYDKTTLRSAHLYQIFAYVKNMDKGNTGNVSGLLLYAKTAEEELPDGDDNAECFIGGSRFAIRALDLDQDFEQIKSQLDSIAQEFLYERESI